MNESIRQYWNKIQAGWLKFSKKQKITLIVIIAVIAISLTTLIHYFSRTEYALAFTDLPENDAAAITEYLDASKTSYVLSEDGKSISVPRSKVAMVKINVVDQGLNKNGAVGYESLKESTFGTTDREFDVKELSMMQGELEKLLNSLDSVQESRVMITLPKSSVFLTDSEMEKSSAAVILKLRPNFSLDQQEVDTMYKLVSMSVKNLPMENITISEASGEPLPYSKVDGALNTATAAAAIQFQIRKQFERDIQSNVTRILNELFPEGRVVPIVIASLNFDKKSSEENLVKPVVDDKGIAISIQEIQENYSGEGSPAGGVAGTGETDVPTYPSDTATTGKTTSEKVQSTINNEVNRIHNVIEKSPYFVNDLTISVGIEPPGGQPLDENLKISIQKLLKGVVSASLANTELVLTDAQLEAKVTVFENNAIKSTAADTGNKINWLLLGGIGALAVLLAGAAGFWLSRRRKNQIQEMDAAPTVIAYPTIDMDAESSETQVRKQLEMLAKKKPEEFVNLLRTWLVDE
ncbi:MAG: flagellar M-ring protein FliF [Gorillibacterium sp.]|nr:flagellar M-ring protein FliF [Gorillibacterium sp.]